MLNLINIYLGMTLNPYGNFSLAREELKEVGFKGTLQTKKRDG